MINAIVLSLNEFAAKAAKRAALLAAGLVIAIVLMLVLPLPVWLLDVLIAVNLCFAGLLVVVAMYIVNPSALSTFPAVLLLTTLFRLALEVATARKILLEGDAGHIVETFGNFVVGGNLVVGLVVFLILTVVQFLVITKGSERVSEVAARFTLDAMPGKQMSIDSDLRAGVLTIDEARDLRAELVKESRLHGAMDGAMKFVKGDAIAGIFIVFVNLVGGISIGVFQQKMPIGDAMQLYSVLSIGDALIAQIPALLISLTAGMITTRVTAKNDLDDEGSNIGQDIAREIFGEPKALVTASVIMLIFAGIPGMPTVVFLILAAGLIVGGGIGMLKPRADMEKQDKQSAEESTKVADILAFKATLPFVVHVPARLYGTPELIGISNAVRIMRNLLLQINGIPDVPIVEFLPLPTVPENTIRFLLADVPLIDTPIRCGWGATLQTAERLAELGFTAVEDGLEGSRKRRVWVRIDDPDLLQEAGVVYEYWENVFASDVRVEMLRNCQMFIGIQESHRFTDWAQRRVPALAKELGKALTPPRLSEVVQRLARESVSLRNVRLLLETILEWAPKERDPDVVADYVRLAFKRQLCHEVARDGLIEVVLLSPELEDTLRAAIRQTSQGSYLDLDPEIEQTILSRLGELVGTGGTRLPVLVTAADLRRAVRKLIEEEFFPVPVFAFSEMTQHLKVQPIGMIET